jgi:hypothetical protein
VGIGEGQSECQSEGGHVFACGLCVCVCVCVCVFVCVCVLEIEVQLDRKRHIRSNTLPCAEHPLGIRHLLSILPAERGKQPYMCSSMRTNTYYYENTQYSSTCSCPRSSPQLSQRCTISLQPQTKRLSSRFVAVDFTSNLGCLPCPSRFSRFSILRLIVLVARVVVAVFGREVTPL